MNGEAKYRADWRGMCIVKTSCVHDYDDLISSGNLFARKFNYEQTPTLVDKLYTYLTSDQMIK